LSLTEPLGLLDGPAAQLALRDGLALPLQGGPFAFLALRDAAGMPLPLSAAPAALTTAPPPFAIAHTLLKAWAEGA
jgi:dihydropteroate synthase